MAHLLSTKIATRPTNNRYRSCAVNLTLFGIKFQQIYNTVV